MDSSTKKVFNTISYVLNLVFIINLIIFLSAYYAARQERLANIDDELATIGNNNMVYIEEANIEGNIEYIKHSIIEKESAEIPLLIQEFKKVHKIRIDSLVLTQSKAQPYSGYLVTVWDIDEKQDLSISQLVANEGKDKYKRKEKVIYVEVDNIITTKTKLSWNGEWTSAYNSIRY